MSIVISVILVSVVLAVAWVIHAIYDMFRGSPW